MKNETKPEIDMKRLATSVRNEVVRLKRSIALLGVFVVLVGVTEAFGVPGRVSQLADRGGVAWNLSGGSFFGALGVLPGLMSRPMDTPLAATREKTDRDCEAFHPISAEARKKFFGKLPYGRLIREKAEQQGVDPILVVAIIANESGFRRNAVSAAGARGLMQLTPETGQWMGAADLHDPAENIGAGVRYLHYLSERFNGDLAKQLAAYNAGEGCVLHYGGVPPFRETRAYVKRVLRTYQKVADELEQFGRAYDERLAATTPKGSEIASAG